MAFGSMIAVASAVWLLSCGASLGALYRNLWLRSSRWPPSLALSWGGLLIGLWGRSFIHLSASKTINGHQEWSLNSEWFFVGAIILAVLALVSTVCIPWIRRSRCDCPPLTERAGPGNVANGGPDLGAANSVAICSKSA